MSEFIGSRISLISKSDIRYVGTLHEINSETSTVALEQVASFGTEGRKQNPSEEIAGSDQTYDYIVFRGSDVKDLRIEEPPKENKPPPPATPNDPAILSGQRPQQPSSGRPNGAPNPGFNEPNQQGQSFGQPNTPYSQFPNQPYGGPQGPYGFNGPPPGRGFPGYPPPFGGPPGGPHGWPGPPPPGGRGFPGQFPPPGPFSPHNAQMPFGGPGPQQHTRAPSQPQHRATPSNQQGPSAPSQALQPTQILQRPSPAAQKQAQAQPPVDQQKSKEASLAPASNANKPPPPPIESKPDPVSAAAPPAPPTAPQNQANGPKSGKIAPAMPLPNAANKTGVKVTRANNAIPPMPQIAKPAANAALQQQNATTQAATAAVAAAMAKLGAAPAQPAQQQAQPKPQQGASVDVVDNLTKKVNEMRVDQANKTHNTPTNHRGRGRDGRRSGSRGIEVPNADFDFTTANAKFNKEELSKTATDGVNGDNVDGGNDIVIPPADTKSYDAKSSFFDNISSEAKDRDDGTTEMVKGPRGREFRDVDRKRNLETFGIGSVDQGGYRGFRGRGRGRGYRGRGRGGGAKARGGVVG